MQISWYKDLGAKNDKLSAVAYSTHKDEEGLDNHDRHFYLREESEA